MQLRTPKRLILITALLIATPACLDTNNSPAPVDMAGDMGPTDQGGDTPVDADLGGDMDLGVDMGPCGGACTDGKVCDPSDGQCVGCLDDAQCGGDTPVCDPTSRACVGCVDTSDCTGGVCNTASQTCVQCLNDDTCNGATPRCETGSNACVACLDHPDCPSTDAAQCAGNSCVACSDNAHCAHLADTPVCDGGSCVQCTVATEDTDCARTVEGENKVFTCHPDTHTCTDTVKGSARKCEACVSDSDCDTSNNNFCVPMSLDGTPVGSFCLQKAPSVGGCQRPYTTPLLGKTTVGGIIDNFCGIDEGLTTCPAFLDYLNPKTCNDTSSCGLGGVCKSIAVQGNVCTITCDRDEQCAGTSCVDDSINGGMTCGIPQP